MHLVLLAASLVISAPAAPRPEPASPPADPAPEALRALAAVLAGEPSIAEVQGAAARHAARGAGDLARFPVRARLAALLPRLTAEYRRDDRSNRVVGLQGSGEVDYLRLAPGTAVVLRATWDLGGLVAARGELDAATNAAARGRRADEAVQRATALYYERQAKRLALLVATPTTVAARAEAELEIDRLQADLDALTGGLFARGGP